MASQEPKAWRLAKPSWTVRILQGVIRFCYRTPWTVLGVALALAVLSVVYASFRLEFATDRSALVNQNEKFLTLSREFQKEFPMGDDIVIVIEGGTREQRQAFVDEGVRRLEAEPRLFQDVFGKFDLPFIRSHALFYFDLPGLKKLVNELEEARPLLEALGSQGGLAGLMERFSSRQEAGPQKLARMLPFLNEVMNLLLESLQTRGRYNYRSPWESVFFGDVPEDAPPELSSAGEPTIYNTLSKGEVHLLLVRVREGADAETSVKRLRVLMREVARSFPGVHTSITGETVLEIDEMNSSTSDATRATVISIFVVAGLFIYAFRELIRPIMIVVVLVVSLAWTIGYTTLAIGHLNLPTVTFGTILVGLGVDFGVNFLLRYSEERVDGLAPLDAMLATMQGTGVENLTGAATTAVAFYALKFMDFTGVAELGEISGVGVMLCFIGMVTMLPAMVFLLERYDPEPPRALINPEGVLARVESFLLSHPWWVLLLAAVFSLLCIFRLNEVHFDYNLLNMQSQQLESVKTELQLVRTSEHSVIFAVAVADNLEEAERKTKAFQKLGTVSAVESFLPLIPAHFEEKVPLVRRVEEVMKGIGLPTIPSEPPGASSLSGMANGFLELEEAFNQAYPKLSRDPDPEVRRQANKFHNVLERLFNTLEKMGPGPIMDGLTTFQVDFFSDLREMVKFLKAQRSGPPITLQELPEQLRSRGLGLTGKIMLRVYPRYNVWEREPLSRFVEEVQKVDPRSVGTPVMMYYHTEAMKRAYEVSGYYAFGVICIILLVHFRSLKDTLLALLPKVLGILWMLGIMVYYRVAFNPANFMALPLVLGIGLVFGVHVLQRAREESSNELFTRSTGSAIVLDALTNVAGFGALMLAHHQGIASLGFVMTVGTLTNMVTSLVVLPAVLQVLKSKKAGPPERTDLPPDEPV